MAKSRGPETSVWPPLDVATTGDGPPLVLLHGGTGSRNHWVRNVPELSRHFTVHTVDSPGFGKSPAPQKDLDPDSYLEWVASAVMRLSDNLALAGFSFGGVVAAAVAVRLGTRVNGLSLLGPGGFGAATDGIKGLLPMPPREAGDQEYREVIAHNLGRSMLLRAPDPKDPVVDLQRDNIRRARFDSRKLSLRDITVSNIAHAQCPVQVIWGQEDPIARPSIDARAERIANARPDVEFHKIPGAGHWVQFEMADAVNERMIEFHLRERG